MSMEDKNKLLDEYLNDVALTVNAQYKGLIDKDKLKELYNKFKDSDKDLKEEIIPEIEDTINELIDEYLDLKRNLESMMELKMNKESEKLASLNNEAVVANEQAINYLVLNQMESKKELEKYISDVCSQFPSLDSQVMLDKFNKIISDEQVQEMITVLSSRYKAELDKKYGEINIGTPEEARTKLAAMGVDTADIDSFVEKVANGERVEAIIQLAEKYGEKVVEKLAEPTDVEENVEETKYEEVNNEVYTIDKKRDKVKRLANPYNNGIGYVAILVAIVSFGIGALSTITYFIISSIFK